MKVCWITSYTSKPLLRPRNFKPLLLRPRNFKPLLRPRNSTTLAQTKELQTLNYCSNQGTSNPCSDQGTPQPLLRPRNFKPLLRLNKGLLGLLEQPWCYLILRCGPWTQYVFHTPRVNRLCFGFMRGNQRRHRVETAYARPSPSFSSPTGKPTN